MRVGVELTQEAAAALCEIDYKRYQRIEAGANVTVVTLYRIANALGVSVGSFFEAARTKKPS